MRRATFLGLAITFPFFLVIVLSLLYNYLGFDTIEKIKHDQLFSPEFDNPTTLDKVILWGFSDFGTYARSIFD